MTTLRFPRVLPVAAALVACVTHALVLAGRFLSLAKNGQAPDVADPCPFVDTHATWKDLPDDVAAGTGPGIAI